MGGLGAPSTAAEECLNWLSTDHNSTDFERELLYSLVGVVTADRCRSLRSSSGNIPLPATVARKVHAVNREP
jgi:hypothetical protein